MRWRRALGRLCFLAAVQFVTAATEILVYVELLKTERPDSVVWSRSSLASKRSNKAGTRQ